MAIFRAAALVVVFAAGAPLAAEELPVEGPELLAPAGSAVPAPQNSPPASHPPQEAAAPSESFVALLDLVGEILKRHIPREYEDDSDWGGTTEVFDGLDVSREGLRIKTKRKTKTVNHGAWSRYKIEPFPGGDGLDVRVESKRLTPEGKAAFDLVVTAHLRLEGRRTRWFKGVHVASLSAEAEARVALRFSCEVGLEFEAGHFPPDVIVLPRVLAADLELVEFRVDRISKLGGDAAKEIGKGIKRILDRRIEEKEDRLVEKLNLEIDEHQDRLRLSPHDLVLEKWSRFFGE